MGYGKIVAFQIEQTANRAKAGLITREQAHEQMNRLLAGVSPADQEEAKAALNRRLRGAT
ncbi:hypothetical protein [Streptomyces sp. ME19-01-6]|uniref:hypothetical protein n=1 Tax=Streptomyces sp. ME19-01-6 TaxID=3028686 RepID=UPI0029B4A62C|nr:hypothetical protein [Streptomyces sp. ME19-01-6]MDX3230589.1 hypothetical protein [Streptomyces sp. ME19-01-6]